MANNDTSKRKTHTSTAVKNKWNANAYDTLNIRVKKGLRDDIKAFADNNGESLNGFVNRLIEEAMGIVAQRDKETTKL